MNGYQQEGMSWFDMTIKNGKRWSAASAYLRPAVTDRSDRLKTQEQVLVTRILFDGRRAVGVEYEQLGQLKRVLADKVILSGGAINSPQLLMLSGVGPADHLREMGIDVLLDLPGVGKNLQVTPITQTTAE